MSDIDIVMRPAPRLIHVLRATLHQIEEREKLSPRDPHLLELKKSLLRRIAELEVEPHEEVDPHSDRL